MSVYKKGKISSFEKVEEFIKKKKMHHQFLEDEHCLKLLFIFCL